MGFVGWLGFLSCLAFGTLFLGLGGFFNTFNSAGGCFFQKMAYVIILFPLRGWHLVTVESSFLLESRLVKSCMHLVSLSLAHIPSNSSSFKQSLYSEKPMPQKKKEMQFSYFQNRLSVLEWKNLNWAPRKMTEQEDWLLAVTILALCTVSNLSSGAWPAQQDLWVPWTISQCIASRSKRIWSFLQPEVVFLQHKVQCAYNPYTLCHGFSNLF